MVWLLPRPWDSVCTVLTRITVVNWAIFRNTGEIYIVWTETYGNHCMTFIPGYRILLIFDPKHIPFTLIVDV